jgi:hypothetical protein
VNFREKYITDHLQLCQQHEHLLDEWERQFVNDSASIMPFAYTTRRYNTLHDIAERLKPRLFGLP